MTTPERFSELDALSTEELRQQAFHLAEHKLAELDASIRRAKAMKRTLRHAMDCRCRTLGECTLASPRR